MAEKGKIKEEQGMIDLANEMLEQLHIKHRVSTLAEIGPNVFVTLFEGLCGEPLQNLVSHPTSQEDQVYNMQVVIDTLASDILNTSMSHITGEDIVHGNRVAVSNMLEVFSGLMEYLLDKIGSDTTYTDNEGDGQGIEDDPDLVTSEVIDDILERELGSGYKESDNSLYRQGKQQSLPHCTEAWNTPDTTADLIALGHDSHIDVSSHVSETTEALINLGETPSKDAASLSGLYGNTATERYMQEHIPGGEGYEKQAKKGGGSSHQVNDLPHQVAPTSSVLESGSSSPAVVLPQQLPLQPGSKFDLLGVRPRCPAAGQPATGGATVAAVPAGGSTCSHAAVGSCVPHHCCCTHHLYFHFDSIAPATGAGVPPFSSSYAWSSTITPTLTHSIPSHATDCSSTFQVTSSHARPTLSQSAHGPSTLSHSAHGPSTLSQSAHGPSTLSQSAHGPSTLSKSAHGPSTLSQSAHGPSTLSKSAHGPSTLSHIAHGPSTLTYSADRPSTLSRSVPRPSTLSRSGGPPLMAPTFSHSRAVPASGHPAYGSDSQENYSGLASGRYTGITSSAAVNKVPYSTTRNLRFEPAHQNLEELVQDTVQMTRNAMWTSPLRGTSTTRGQHGLPEQPGSRLDEEVPTHTEEELSLALRDTLKNIHLETKQIVNLTPGLQHPKQSNTAPPLNQRPSWGTSQRPSQDDSLAPKKENRKVSFVTSRSLSDVSVASLSDVSASDLILDNGKQVEHHPARSQSRSEQFEWAEPRTSPLRPKGSKNRLATSIQEDKGHLESHSTPPKTFSEYLEKYYGIVDRRDQIRNDQSEDDASQCNEGVSSQGDPSSLERSNQNSTNSQADDADVSSVETEIQRLRSQMRQQNSKAVRFEDVLDGSPANDVGLVRRKMHDEERSSRVKARALDHIYQSELEDFEKEANGIMHALRKSAKTKETEYKKKVLRKPKMTKYNPAQKYGVSPLRLTRARGRSSSQGRQKKAKLRTVKSRKRSASASPILTRGRHSPVDTGDGDILPMLLEEFPFLCLTTETLHELWRKSSRQIELLSKAQQEVRSRKSQAQIQIEEAARRQKILMDIMKKELAHNKRMKDIKQWQHQQQLVKSSLREKRQQSARARKYYDEYQVRARSKMMKKRTKEELIFRHLFNHGLEIQKERIREVRRYAREQRQERSKRQQEELEALENYYRDQFSMLAEKMSQERSNLSVREKAQSKILAQMKRELRQKMESEIKNFQEQLYRDEDEEYFRQLDADRLRYQLQMARYQAGI